MGGSHTRGRNQSQQPDGCGPMPVLNSIRPESPCSAERLSELSALPTGRSDVLIAGGGFAGLALAVALRQSLGGDFTVTLADPDLARTGQDARASAVAAAPRRMFDALGVWTAVADDAQPILDMVVTDSRIDDAVRPALLTFGGEIEPGEPFAHMIENGRLIAALAHQATAVGVNASVVTLPDDVDDAGLRAAIETLNADDETQGILMQLPLPPHLAQRTVAEAKKKMSFTKLRFWSAGCSTGEEPYTLAMLMIEETLTNLKGWTFEIIATDLNDRSVAKAQEGIYSDYAVRNVPPDFMRKYINKTGTDYRIADSVKSHITFSRMNLLEDSKMLFMRGFDVIFCCNVLIYFDGKSKSRTIQHFYNALGANGYFFLGQSESLYGINDKFHLVHFPGTTAYWKPPEGGTKAGTP